MFCCMTKGEKKTASSKSRAAKAAPNAPIPTPLYRLQKQDCVYNYLPAIVKELFPGQGCVTTSREVGMLSWEDYNIT